MHGDSMLLWLLMRSWREEDVEENGEDQEDDVSHDAEPEAGIL